MTFSYSGDPATSALDAVRFLVGDTDESEPLLQDGEINFLIQQWKSKGTPYYTAAMAADAIAAKLAREVSISSDGQTLSLAELQEKYARLSQQLREQHEDALVGGSSLHVGGMDAYESYDPSVAPLAFGTRMHDNPEAGQQDYGDAGHYFDNEWWVQHYGAQP